MAEIRKVLWLRHLRAEPSMHVVRYRRGKTVQSGRGASFWFTALNSAVAEVPMDDRDLHFLFHARSADFQDVTVQGVVAFRVVEPDLLGQRIDFGIDLETGSWLKTPLGQIDALLTGMAQAKAAKHIAERTVQSLLAESVEAIQTRIADGLVGAAQLAALGIEATDVRVSDIRPTPELEAALQTPTREAIQQRADEATFGRRALAVEKECAIADNELKNQIELAKREESLIEQRGANERRRVQDEADARRIEVEGKAQRICIEADATAQKIKALEAVKVEAEEARMDVYKELPSSVMMGLAARELAGKLQRIEHLNLSPELLGPMLQNLIEAGTKRLKG